MVDKLKRALGIVFISHIVAGFVLIVTLALASEVVIGVGHFDDFVNRLETFDFRWWLVGIASVGWLLPILLVITWRRAKEAGIEVDKLRARVRELLEGSAIPIKVDIDTRIPVNFDTALHVPVQISTKVDIDSDMEIEAAIPIRTELPIDTMIETSVLGIGKISVPIKARLPLDVVVPIHGTLRIKASGIPIEIDEEVRIELPTIEIPLKCRIETKIDLLSNLEAAEEAIRKGLPA